MATVFWRLERGRKRRVEEEELKVDELEGLTGSCEIEIEGEEKIKGVVEVEIERQIK